MCATLENATTLLANIVLGSANATDVINISIWQPGEGGPNAISEFPPEFTYSIFGENESIFGYRDLRIDMAFTAHDLNPNVDISYGAKFKTVGGTKAANITEILQDFMPDGRHNSQSRGARANVAQRVRSKPVEVSTSRTFRIRMLRLSCLPGSYNTSTGGMAASMRSGVEI